jgi:2-polyprenyl-3-methyl-5-hydroxy-6-metoxy-1,4-benzoquinol methylase
MIYKNENYYSNIRHDLVSLITKKKDLKILEIGAGYGETLTYLKESGRAKEIVGVDLNYNKSKKNLYGRLDNFIYGDIEKLSLKEYSKHFDVIILADILEHLSSPLSTLKKLKINLKQDGEIIASIPNIRSLNALYKIFLKGSFSYEEEGLFDSTHLRFFCKKDMITLFEKSNYKISFIESSLKNYKGKSIKKNVNKITFGLFEEFLTTQYFIRAENE